MILLEKLLTRISICSELLGLANHEHYQRLCENSKYDNRGSKKNFKYKFFMFKKTKLAQKILEFN